MAWDKRYRKALEKVIVDIRNRAQHSGKKAVFCIGTTMNVGNEEYFFSSLREAEHYVCGNMMVSGVNDLPQIIEIIDGRIDEILIDVEKKKAACSRMDAIIGRCVKKSKVSYFRGNLVAACAFEQIFLAYCAHKGIDFADRRACVVGAGHLGAKIAQILLEYGMQVDLYDRNQSRARKVTEAITTMAASECRGKAYPVSTDTILKEKYLLIAGVTNGIPAVTVQMVERLENDGFLIDAGLKTVTEEAMSKAHKVAKPVFCLVATPGFNGMMLSHFEADKIISSLGRRAVEGDFSLVSGGMMGEYGDVIVDDVVVPTKVIGVAKGDGLVLVGQEKDKFHDRVSLVKSRYLKEKK